MDIQQSDPKDSELNIQNDLQQVDYCLSDLTRATDREKVKLILKTSTREIQTFIKQLSSSVRFSYPKLYLAMVAEYLPLTPTPNLWRLSMVAQKNLKTFTNVSGTHFSRVEIDQV